MRRNQHGAYSSLLKELESEDPSSYRNFLRMDNDTFNELLSLVTPMIEKKSTTMREAISPGERLALTLRYLATGYSFILAENTCSK